MVCTAVLRYFNAPGSDSDTEIGEDHEPETHLTPWQFVPPFSARRGDRFELPDADGTAVRDYIHVSDLAVANVKALQRLQAGGDSMVSIWARGAATRCARLSIHCSG